LKAEREVSLSSVGLLRPPNKEELIYQGKKGVYPNRSAIRRPTEHEGGCRKERGALENPARREGPLELYYDCSDGHRAL